MASPVKLLQWTPNNFKQTYLFSQDEDLLQYPGKKYMDIVQVLIFFLITYPLFAHSCFKKSYFFQIGPGFIDARLETDVPIFSKKKVNFK